MNAGSLLNYVVGGSTPPLSATFTLASCIIVVPLSLKQQAMGQNHRRQPFGPLAKRQMQRTFNPYQMGSTPIGPTKHFQSSRGVKASTGA